MPTAWIEKNVSARVKRWAFNQLKSRRVFFSGDRQKQGYPVVAEIPVDNDDIKKFAPDLDKAVTIIMFSQGVSIDDPNFDFGLNNVKVHVECVD